MEVSNIPVSSVLLNHEKGSIREEIGRWGKRLSTGSILVWLLLFIGGCLENLAFGQPPIQSIGYSPDNPAPVGAVVVAKIVMGDTYVMLFETYEARITFLEIVRGGEAWNRVREANASNAPPKDGFEYILARIRVEYHSTNRPGDKGYELSGSRFTAISLSGKEYEHSTVVTPKPELRARLYSGDSCQGNVVFMVAQEDKKPLMTFGREYDGGIWFQLY